MEQKKKIKVKMKVKRGDCGLSVRPRRCSKFVCGIQGKKMRSQSVHLLLCLESVEALGTNAAVAILRRRWRGRMSHST